MWYVYTMEFYSPIKKNEILSFAGKWLELENITFSETHQIQKAKVLMFSLISGIQAQYKYKQYYTYMQIQTELISKSGTGRGDKGGKQEGMKDNN
jgi:hypothetical protein